MVNAATDIQYGNEFYKVGSKLPDHLVKEFEQNNPSLLDDHIEVNGRWLKINDKRISGMVKERKMEFKRLRNYFNIPYVPPKKEEEDNSNMLRVHKKKEPVKESKKEKKYIETELKELSFSKLRKIGYNFKPRIRERSKARLVKQILKAQNAR